MGKKSAAAEVEHSRTVELAGKAFAMRLAGQAVTDIALALSVSELEVEALVKVAHGRLSVQSADEARAEVEGRLDALLRQVNRDVVLASSQAERTALYRVVLAIERDRATLLGLDIPKGAPDA